VSPSTATEKKHQCTVSDGAIQAIVGAYHGQPFHVLGPHVEEVGGAKRLFVRAFVPDAKSVQVLESGTDKVLAEATRCHDAGFYEADLGEREPSLSQLRVETNAGTTFEYHDPYQFPGQLTDFDLHLLREGTHHRIWEKLGSHPVTVNGVVGYNFAVWAPNARRVSIVGDFNAWDGRRHPMRKHEGLGIWELFIPGLHTWQNYKYELLPSSGDIYLLKVDPFAFHVEVPPKTAARLYDVTDFKWTDEAWMEKRRNWNYLSSPISIYEVHMGSWMRVPEDNFRSLSYREAAEKMAAYVKDMGYTHVELMPITEHPFFGSWGYQTVNFFAPTGRYGNPHDLAVFIDTMHKNGIGVILDWVPAHFPTDNYGLAEFDGTHLYEHADPRQGRHPDWNTLVFNWGRTEVWNFLLSNALFWLDQYHFDGLRVDAVASMLYLDYSRKEGEWIPNRFGGKENLEAIEFLKHMNMLVHQKHPGVLTIAEESTAFTGVSKPVYLGGLGFSLKWNMGWMHDTLEYFSKDPIYRKYHSNKLTFSMLYAYSENFCLSFSHDEVVHGKCSMLNKMPGDEWQKRANLRALFGYYFGHPGKKLHFMGAEIGQWNEWNHDSSLDWHLLQYPSHQGIQQWVKDLNRFYRSQPALYEKDHAPEGFRWIDCSDMDNSIYSFMRFANDPSDFVVVISNLTPMPRQGYRIGVPEPGYYAEELNSDAAVYGGANIGNNGGLWADHMGWQGFGYSLNLTLPPLSTVILKKRRQ